MLSFNAFELHYIESLRTVLSPLNIEGLKDFFAKGNTKILDLNVIFNALKVALKVDQFKTFEELFLCLNYGQARRILERYKIELLYEAILIDHYEPMRDLINDILQKSLTHDDLKNVLYICVYRCQLRGTKQFLAFEGRNIPFVYIESTFYFIQSRINYNHDNIMKPNNTENCTHLFDWQELLNVVASQANPTQTAILHQFRLPPAIQQQPLLELPARIGPSSKNFKYKCT